MTTALQTLPEKTDDQRLSIYKLLISACTHLYSKGQLQADKFRGLSVTFAELAKRDPIFCAHFAAWAARGDSKDMQVMSLYFNALSDADGQPFFKGASANKPNYRQVSAALLQQMDPHLALRVCELARLKWGVPGLFDEGAHFPKFLHTAFRKYLRYREQRPEILWGARKAGLAGKLRSIYRLTGTRPSDEAVSVLAWPQRDGRGKPGSDVTIFRLPNFAKLSSHEIAEALRASRLSTLVALSVVPKNKITVEVAQVLLENCTGNQAVILYNWFAANGFLDVQSIKAMFKDKVQQSTTAVDRIDTLTREAAAEDKLELAEVRAGKRKRTAQLSAIGKIFMHVDCSTSMTGAIEFAKEKAAIIAECVDSPEDNFAWGLFGTRGRRLPLPAGFTKEAFHQTLYGVRASDGSTDCFALYEQAREFGADVDIYVTDGEHNAATETVVRNRIERHGKPKAAVIVHMGCRAATLEALLRRANIPVAIIAPEALSESALVAQSVHNAIRGELAIIEAILDTPLPALPRWWLEIDA